MSGPLDGNPYAQIDPSLKEHLRLRSAENKLSLQRGIEDLDGLLDDLGYKSTDSTDFNGNKITSSRQKTTTATMKVQYSMNGQVEAEKIFAAKDMPVYKRAESFSSDDVFNSTSAAVNSILSELDNSPLNSTNRFNNSRGSIKKETKLSAYDNSYDVDSDDGPSPCHHTNCDSREGSIEEVEIMPGTVAKHVKTLNNVLFVEANDYNKKYGVPLAGMNSPELVEQKVTAFNSRSVAPGYCSSSKEMIYHSQGPIKVVTDHTTKRSEYGVDETDSPSYGM